MKAAKELKTTLRPVVLALAAAAAAALVAGCSDATGKAADAHAAPAAPPVSAAVVVQKPVAEVQEFSGRLEAIERVEIRPRVSGYITSVNFVPGAEVKKGQLLFVVDPRPYQAEAERAEAAAGSTRAKAELARVELARAQRLLGDKAIAQREYDERAAEQKELDAAARAAEAERAEAAAGSARAKAELARVELARAQRLLGDKAIAQREYDERAAEQKELDAAARAAEAQAQSARLNLAYTRVTAPIDGRVSKAEITVGNLVDGSNVLTSIVSLDRIYASFDGDEQTYLGVSKQARSGKPVPVRVGLANEQGFPHEGKLEFVDNQLDAGTGSVRMRAVFANVDHSMAPGLFARVQVGAGAEHPAILIDDRAVATDQDRKYVFVVGPGGKAEYRAISLGPTVDGLRVVRTGLKPGETIVVGGLQRVHPGAPVTPQIVPMQGEAAIAAAKGDRVAVN